jgi:hypothetical protein
MNEQCLQQDKRRVQRFDLRLHTLLQEQENQQKGLEIYTRNISSDGAYLCMEQPLPLDTPVELTFFLPLRHKIRSKIQTSGRVIRSDTAGMAVRFGSTYHILAV